MAGIRGRTVTHRWPMGVNGARRLGQSQPVFVRRVLSLSLDALSLSLVFAPSRRHVILERRSDWKQGPLPRGMMVTPPWWTTMCVFLAPFYRVVVQFFVGTQCVDWPIDFHKLLVFGVVIGAWNPPWPWFLRYWEARWKHLWPLEEIGEICAFEGDIPGMCKTD